VGPCLGGGSRAVVWGPVFAARWLWCGALSLRLDGCGVGPCLCGSRAVVWGPARLVGGSRAVVWGPVEAHGGRWCGAQGPRRWAVRQGTGRGAPAWVGGPGGRGVSYRGGRGGRRGTGAGAPAASPLRRRGRGAGAPQARARVLMCVGGPPGFLALPLLVSERLLFGFFGGRFGGTRALSRAQQRGGLFASWGDEASVGSRPRTGGAGIKQRHGPPRAHARRGGHGPGGVGTKHEAPGPGQGWGEGKTALAYEGGGGARHARARARTGPQGYRVDGCPRLGKAKRRGRGTGPAGHDGRAKARPGGGAPPRGSGNRKTRVGR
jgi:hypothetical protein